MESCNIMSALFIMFMAFPVNVLCSVAIEQWALGFGRKVFPQRVQLNANNWVGFNSYIKREKSETSFIH